jgi:hypothetical protein
MKMVCGSPSRGILLVVLVVVVFQSLHGVVSFHVDDSGVYYERYPLHGSIKSDNEQINSSKTNVFNRNESVGDKNLHDDDNGFSVNCTEPTIQDFPPDMFTQEQRQKGYFNLPSRNGKCCLFNRISFFYYFIPLGGVVVHFILCIYTMLMIGVVIDEYFVPSLEIIAEGKYINPMLNQFIF